MTLLTESSQLRAACERLRGTEYVAVDTEFHRESSYWPQLCLAQVAGPDDAWAVDALAPGIDLAPLWEVLADPGVLKVVHAGRQDVEIFLHLSGAVPAPLFDTQVAAMVCGFGESASYESLVERLAAARLDKHSRFTDWRRRPLTDRQLAYALADAVHLRAVYDALSARLESAGRRAWVADEMAALTDASTYVTAPEDAWKRIRLRSPEPRLAQVVRELAAWREHEAQARDLARGRILKDDALVAIAAHPPKTRQELADIRGVSKGSADGPHGDGILAAVASAMAVPSADLPKRERPKKTDAGILPVVELLRVLLKAKCESQGVAPALVANGDDLRAIALGEAEGVRALTGWRRDVFGDDALRVAGGDAALAARRGSGVTLVPLEGRAPPR